MTGVIEGVFIAGAGLKLLDQFRGGEDLKNAQRQCIHELFSKYLAKDFANEGLVKGGMRINLRAGANQHISSAYHYVEQYLNSKGKATGFNLFGKNTSIEIREAVALYLKKWLVSLSSEEGNIEAQEIRMHLDFARQILMRADLFHSTGSDNTFLRALAFVCDELEKILDHLQGENRTASKVLDRICHAGRETVNLVIPIMLFSIVSVIPLTVRKMHWNANTILATRGYELELKAHEAAQEAERASAQKEATPPKSPASERRDALEEEAKKRKEQGEEDEQSEAFLNFWDSPTGKALHKILQSPHCIELMGWKRHQSADDDYELTVDDLRPYAFGFATETLELYMQFFKSLDTFIYFLTVLQKYQALAASAGDVLMCYLYATLNHLVHELEVALVHLHQIGSRLLAAGKKQLQMLLKRAKTLPEAQIAWICRLRYIDEEQLGGNHKCMFDLFNELRQLSAMDRLPTVQQAILRNVRSLRDAFHSDDYQSRATMALEGPAFNMLENVLSRVAAMDVNGENNMITDGASYNSSMALGDTSETEEDIVQYREKIRRPISVNPPRGNNKNSTHTGSAAPRTDDYAAYPNYYADYGDYGGASSTTSKSRGNQKIVDLDRHPSQDIETAQARTQDANQNASLAWIQRALDAEKEAQKEQENQEVEEQQLARAQFRSSGDSKSSSEKMESTPSTAASKTRLESSSSTKKVPTPSPPYFVTSISQPLSQVNTSSSPRISPLSPSKSLIITPPASHEEDDARYRDDFTRGTSSEPIPLVNAAKTDIISFVNSAWKSASSASHASSHSSSPPMNSSSGGLGRVDSRSPSPPSAMAAGTVSAAPAGLLQLSEEESAFYESLWAVIAVDGGPLDRSKVAELVEGKIDQYSLNDFERALSFPINMRRWDFNNLVLLLRSLACMQQGVPIDVSEPPTTLPVVAGYVWDATRSRLRGAQWNVGQ